MTILTNYASFRQTFSVAKTLSPDGYEVWDVGDIYDATWSAVPRPITAFPITIGASEGASHAYLSQRTDVVADQYLEITAANATVDQWTIGLSVRGVAELGVLLPTTTLTPAQVAVVLRDVTLYGQRISDHGTSMLRLDQASLSHY